MPRKHGHYYRTVAHLDRIDVYRVLSLYEQHDPCIQHAVKKLLLAGNRGSKDFERDVSEAIDTLERCLEMFREDHTTGTDAAEKGDEVTGP